MKLLSLPVVCLTALTLSLPLAATTNQPTAQVLTADQPMRQIDKSAGYQTPEELLEYARQYNRVARQLTQAGYVSHGCQIQPLYYLMQPTEVQYLAATANCTFNIPAQNYSLQTDYAQVSVELYYDQSAQLYREGLVQVIYSTVY